MDTFLLPDGSNFDCEIGLGHVDDLPPCTVSKGQLRQAVEDRLAMYGLKAEQACSFRHIAAEVGDDEEAVFRSPTAAALDCYLSIDGHGCIRRGYKYKSPLWEFRGGSFYPPRWV